VSLSLQITHEVFFAPPNSFLAIILQLPTQFLCSQAHIPVGWRLETRLNSSQLNFFYNHFARIMQKTRLLYCWEGVFTAPFHSDGSYSIVVCVFVDAGMCLPSHCLPMDVSSDFTIPAFERRVTISSEVSVRISSHEMPVDT
jgi:hypothetical protein